MDEVSVPFLSIYTPTYKRPGLLERCKRSVAEQTLQDLEHVVAVDEVGVGISGMYEQLSEDVLGMRGVYGYILQDDDILAGSQVVERLRKFAEAERWPDVIMCRNVKRGCIFPTYWGAEPRLAHVDLGNFVVRLDVMREFAGYFGKHYAGDYDFIHAVWERGRQFSWLDMLISREQLSEPGLGRTEAQLVRC